MSATALRATGRQLGSALGAFAVAKIAAGEALPNVAGGARPLARWLGVQIHYRELALLAADFSFDEAQAFGEAAAARVGEMLDGLDLHPDTEGGTEHG